MVDSESLTETQYFEVFAKMQRLGASGDVAAARVVIDHGAGKPNPTPPDPMEADLELPPLTDSKSILEAVGIVVDALASGVIDPEHATKLLDAIEGARKAVDTHSVIERIEALERDRDQLGGLD